jgi:hypothetical protein
LTVAVRHKLLRFPAYFTDRHDHLLMARVGCFSVVGDNLGLVKPIPFRWLEG